MLIFRLCWDLKSKISTDAQQTQHNPIQRYLESFSIKTYISTREINMFLCLDLTLAFIRLPFVCLEFLRCREQRRENFSLI